jgi:hypothetical protein
MIKSRINGTRVVDEKCIQPLIWKTSTEENVWGTPCTLEDNIKMVVKDTACECLK